MSRTNRARTAPSYLLDSGDAAGDRLLVALLGGLGIAGLAVPSFALPVVGVIIVLLVARSLKERFA